MNASLPTTFLLQHETRPREKIYGTEAAGQSVFAKEHITCRAHAPKANGHSTLQAAPCDEPSLACPAATPLVTFINEISHLYITPSDRDCLRRWVAVEKYPTPSMSGHPPVVGMRNLTIGSRTQ
ncbi:hypothetical protein LTR47_005761 [Exophiala xenobiotica]|nr:hypothetical protein LTR47_005761 [Exophiala xenobiotica]KAK5242195.1 hypothetical protein LTS06_011674 [Exophiala xenobiotica]KAK5351061.1 hypothetical protein LTR61_005414 [Exophiala xenobiotica]KAK5374040.1 hypothetical protein LTS03_006195 [Exophiala xenobiotica]KAK5374351.1 hypothetical protein LTR11_005558 [Exophiala xenobiotica]